MNDLALSFFIPADENPDLPGKMPRGAIIFGAAAMAGLVLWAVTRSASAASGTPTIGPPQPPTPGPGPVPPAPPTKPTQPKDGGGAGPIPEWADPNPYGFNTLPGDPFVAPDALWVSDDCQRWKMGRQWFPETANPVIQAWINNGWTADHPQKYETEDVYIQIGSNWAWGYEVAREVLMPFLRIEVPQGSLCWDGFAWPWQYRDMFRIGEQVLNEQTQEWEVECPAAHEDSPYGIGTTCLRTGYAAKIQEDRELAAAAFPAIFADPGQGEGVGLIWLVWNVWANLSYNKQWNDAPVQETLNGLTQAMA